VLAATSIKVLEYSLDKHCRDAADRYQLLLTTAMEDVGDQPLHDGSRPVSERPGIRSYSISHRRLRLPRERRVARPAHQLVYRIASDDVVEILAVIGDSYPPARVRVPR